MADTNRKVVVHGSGKGFRHEVQIGPFSLVADAGPEYGSDTGPNPYDFLMTALGTCTAMTVRGYALQAGIPLQEMRVTISHASVYAKDCRECHIHTGTIEEITREIDLGGPLSDEQRQALLGVAAKCPVSRVLAHKVAGKLVTRLVGGSATVEVMPSAPPAN